MEKYVMQLIDDMQVSERSREDYNASGFVQVDSEKSFEDHLMEIEKYFQNENLKSISEIIGLELIQFPPSDRLEIYQMKEINKSLTRLLSTWCIEVDMPKVLPANKKYALLLSVFNKRVPVLNSGTVHIELCDYNVKSCPFGEQFCNCKDWEQA
ncbi:hypothetical protein V7S79_00915 [Aquirufa sp. ROCK-SH2]